MKSAAQMLELANLHQVLTTSGGEVLKFKIKYEVICELLEIFLGSITSKNPRSTPEITEVCSWKMG